jgi:UDPglucose 6-dehydrogenase
MAFKPDSDDIRDSPALDIAESLARAGATVISADPQAVEPAKRRLAASGLGASLSLTDNHRQAATGADAIVVATEWAQFSAENPEDIAKLVRGTVVIDGRNCLDAAAWKAAGFRYRGMGRS